MEILFLIIFLMIAISLLKKIWPFLILGAIGLAIYWWPVYTISILLILSFLAYLGNESEKKTKKKILQVIQEEKIIDLEGLAKSSGKDLRAVGRILDDLEKNGKVVKEIVREKKLYKSLDYRESSSVKEITLD